ncbi:YafY family transcriptional regulator [Tissierella sp. MSJ-40]|uniref:YafY family transcriptional regulator n=1 Tax=Tissierella simiarum TaxID=2841534 RepID=A0ABS6E3I1_9FIRM|nr:YafY family protein [Tissierella simiarum]MBU5437337.1 YafY family transcriptional regulator [Tissierella simiarum]
MKINRLFEIVVILLNKGTVTAKELSERFGVSTRTIYRDIDTLSSAGVPVYTNKGKGGGISLLDNYSLSRTLISEQESESLILALKTLQTTKYPEINIILDKMGALFNKIDTDDWVHIDFSHWGSSPNEYNKFLDIKSSIIGRKVIYFDYVNSDGIKSKRYIEPMRLIFKGQAWYLWGYCREREDFRIFRISRIKNLFVTEEVFQRKEVESSQKKESREETTSLVTLKLHFQPEALSRVFDYYDEEYIIKNADGTCSVTVTFPEDEWIYGHIMSFGNFVEVVEPEHIRKIVVDRMKKALKVYEK